MIARNLKLVYATANVRLGFLVMACALTGLALNAANAALPSWQVLVLSLSDHDCV